jgi:excisionase family DNA binding protein
MSAENMSTKEVAEYLGINEKQVYALIKTKSIPCTRVTGKWIFPRKLIDRWITVNAMKNGQLPDDAVRSATGALFAAGSNDPVLDILINHIRTGDSGHLLFSTVTGSTEGLRLLGNGLVDIAWCHLSDPGTGEYDSEKIKELVPGKKFAIVHLFRRETGFLVRPDSEIKKISMKTVAEKKLRFINRQKGSGTRIITDHILESEGIDAGSITGYGDEVSTHLEIGLKILSGEYDTGIATESVAKILGLKIYPLVKENFDMALLLETFFKDEVQNFISTLKSDSFRSMVSCLGNYDFSKSGKIVYSTP